MAFPAAAAMPLNSPRRPSTGRHILGTPGESHPSDRHKSTLFRAHRPCDRLSLDSVTAARGSTPRQRKCRVPLTVSKRNTHNRSHCFITAAAGAEQGLQGLGLHQALGVPQGSQRLSPRLHRSPSSPSTPQLAKGPLRCRHKSQVTSRKSQVTESQGPASQEWSQEEAQAGLPEPQPRAPLLLVPMLALALVLCNADRVIMSVTVVPLSVLNAWTPTTAGVVQVRNATQGMRFSMGAKLSWLEQACSFPLCAAAVQRSSLRHVFLPLCCAFRVAMRGTPRCAAGSPRSCGATR